jgi:hypothetical protein
LNTIGRIFGILAIIGVDRNDTITMMDKLANILLAIIGLMLSIIGKSKGGIVICVVAIFFGLFRHAIGGGYSLKLKSLEAF